MGTSANRKGPKPNIPLLPDWIEPLPVGDGDTDGGEEEGNNSEDGDNENINSKEDKDKEKVEIPQAVPKATNRFNSSQRGFSKAVKLNDSARLNRAVKTYVRTSGGGSATLARRMSRSGGAVVRLGDALESIRRSGLEPALRSLHLGEYVDRPAFHVLTALMDFVCETSALLDDAITRQAYANTVVEIDKSFPDLELEAITEPQICEMLAMFIEHTIVYRIICDVGRKLTTGTSDVKRSIEMERDLYQIVNGFVRGKIVPALRTTIDERTLNFHVEDIYRLAFDTITNS